MCIRDRFSFFAFAQQNDLRITYDANQGVSGLAGASKVYICLLYTSDAADERSSVDLGGRRIIKKKNHQ